VGSEDDFAMKDTRRARLKPLEVEREIRDDLYLVVFSVRVEKPGATSSGRMESSAGHA
jgi:hypothetical protein